MALDANERGVSTLRRAGVWMRQRADQAEEVSESTSWRPAFTGDWVVETMDRPDGVTEITKTHSEEEAFHIAGLDPRTARAISRLLIFESEAWSLLSSEHPEEDHTDVFEGALAIATAYLDRPAVCECGLMNHASRTIHHVYPCEKVDDTWKVS